MAGSEPGPIEFGVVRAYAKAGRVRDGEVRYWVIRVSGRRGRTLECLWATRDEAQKRCAAWDATERGEHIPPPPPKGVRTAGKVLREWLATYITRKDLDPKTLRATRVAANHLLDVVDRIAATDGRAIARAYTDQRRADGAASSTIQREWRVLRQAWAAAMDRDRTLRDIPKVLELNHRRVYDHHTPSDDDVGRVIAWLRERGAKRVNGARWAAIALSLAWYTGMRVGEVELLQWKHVDLRSRTLRIRGKRSGGDAHRDGRWRMFPAPRDLMDELERWRAERWPGADPDPDAVVLGTNRIARGRGRDLIHAACAAMGIQPFAWHGVRRRVVRRMRVAKLHPVEAAALLGHSPVVMMRHYDEVDPMEMAGKVPVPTKKPKE